MPELATGHRFYLICAATISCSTEVKSEVKPIIAGIDFSPYFDQLAAYQNQLQRLRQAWGGTYTLPQKSFFLFGMGTRPKLIYRDGALLDCFTGKVRYQWAIRSELIIPPAYMVLLETHKQMPVAIYEDAQAIWLFENGQATQVKGDDEFAAAPGHTRLQLPDFAAQPYGLILRVLLQEILINIVGGQPLPNLFAYTRPWYRDAAMTARVLQETNNLDLIRQWIMELRDPFDRNNAGETEADNLGQALYLVSLVADFSHPLVQVVMDQLPHFATRSSGGKQLSGQTDFANRPVYQTKWLKYGLRLLELPDPYTIPLRREDYSALFWWDYKERHIPMERMLSLDYPYLTWACDSFYNERNGYVSGRDYPLTWERNASQADYTGMSVVSPEYTQRQLCAPHAWHAAEMFFRLKAEKYS